jgi:hypothetical protein
MKAAAQGLSLGEAMVSMALMLVVMVAVAGVCRDVSRISNFSSKKDRAVAVELRMLDVARECSEGREWLSPLPPSTAVVPEVRFRKLDPQQSHEPPLDADRLPALVPRPPLASWDGFAPAFLVTVRYHYGPDGLQRNGVAVAPVRSDFACRRLPDGRLQLEYSYVDGAATVRRSLAVLPVVPP